MTHSHLQLCSVTSFPLIWLKNNRLLIFNWIVIVFSFHFFFCYTFKKFIHSDKFKIIYCFETFIKISSSFLSSILIRGWLSSHRLGTQVSNIWSNIWTSFSPFYIRFPLSSISLSFLFFFLKFCYDAFFMQLRND